MHITVEIMGFCCAINRYKTISLLGIISAHIVLHGIFDQHIDPYELWGNNIYCYSEYKSSKPDWHLIALLSTTGWHCAKKPLSTS